MVKILLFLGIASFSSFVGATTLEEFLEQVKKQNKSYQGAVIQMEGAKLSSREADLFFTPTFFFDARKGHDGKLFSPPFLIYDFVRSESYSLGIKQQFSFGLETTLGYELLKTEYMGVDFGDVASSYWDAAPKIELSLPIWGNGFGRTSRARKELSLQQRRAEHYSGSGQAKRNLVEAEVAYWRLAAAQESMKVQEQALKAAENILSYVTVKRSKNLGEDADILQAKALVESYKLALQQSGIEERAARRQYNLYLNQDADADVEVLSVLDYKNLEVADIPQKRPGNRADVKAAEAQLAVAKASSAVSHEMNKPTLDLYGGYRLNGRGDQTHDAISNAGGTRRDAAYVGLRLQVPLNLSATSDAREGALKSQRAAELNHQYTFYAQEQEWIDLSAKFKDAKDSLKLARVMEGAQKAKLENERVRLRQGRTTTYQILLFEQDHISAQVARIRAASQILALKSQVKLYGTSESEGSLE